ncbi:hypothetical protein BDB01DRAFT_805940 [Pilobolus umbonatus]|nr:hypothetical protein BDB01DRAFT_805940 [Pilobolus umbonatus]
MSDLPYEILKIISTHLDAKDIYSCIFVNHLWKAAFIPGLYSKIKLAGAPIIQFMHSITHYPGVQENGKYVKHVTILFKSEIYDPLKDYNFIPEHLFQWCPNIEYLITQPKHEIIEYLSKPCNGLKRLQCLFLHDGYETIEPANSKVLDCYYQYREVLRMLYLSDYADYNEYDSNRLLTYLESFPLLLDLNLDVTCMSHSGVCMLDEILRRCSLLISIDLKCTRMHIPTGLSDPMNYKNIRSLVLGLQEMSPEDARYLCDGFPNLVKLNLSIEYYIDDTLVNQFLQLTHLEEFNMSFLSSFSILESEDIHNNPISLFYERAPRKNDEEVSQKLMLEVCDVEPYLLKLSMDKCSKTKKKVLEARLCLSDQTECLAYYKEVAKYVNDFTLVDSTINLNFTNNVYAPLYEISFECSNIIIKDDVDPLDSVKKISLNHCRLDQALMTKIEQTYPNLEAMALYRNRNRYDKRGPTGVEYIQLPSGLIRFNMWHSVLVPMNLFIARTKEGVIKRLARFDCTGRKRPMYKDKESIDQLLKSLVGPAYIFQSDSIVNGDILPIDY